MRPLLRASILFFAFFSAVSGLFGQSIRVLVVTGDVTLQAPGDAAPRPAVKGDVVPAGTRLVTGPGARLVLTPFPGIKSMLAENSTLVVERAQSVAQSGTATLQQATLDLKTGVIVSDLEKQEGIAYDYSVKTPRGVAGARGTIYAVAVNREGVESVLVSDGSIHITLTDGTTLVLAPTQASLTRPGAAPVAVSRLSDLPPADQAILQSVMEITLETIAAAIEAGVDLQPDALQLTLQFAQDFGFVIDAELLASLQAALATEDTAESGVMFDAIDSLPQNITSNTNEVTEIVTTISTEIPTTDDPETAFANSLSPTRKAAFLRRPSDIRAKLLQLNEPGYTNLVLDPDPVTGLEYTNTEVRDALANVTYLKVHDLAAFEFLKEVSGGTDLPNADTAPSPTEHSLASFQLMGETWSALSPDEQATLTNLGAGESIMGTSASYLSSLLNILDGYTAARQDTVSDTGWGAYLTDIVSESSLLTAVDTASGYTADQRATIQSFDLSPYPFANSSTNTGALTSTAQAAYFYGDPTVQLDALAALPADDQLILRRLELKDRLFNYNSGYYDGETYVPVTFDERLQLTLNFFKALSPEQQTLLLSLDAGHWLFESAPSEYFSVGDSSTNGLALAQDILTQFAALSGERKEAADTLGLFDHIHLDDDRLTTAIITEAIDAYLAAPASVQRFLRDEFSGSTVLDITVGTYSEYSARSLSAITTILSALTDAELDTLRDMGIGETLAMERFFPTEFEGGNTEALTVNMVQTPGPALTPGAQLKAMVNFYDGLTDGQQQTLKELGILGTKDNFATFLADFEGLGSLLGAYSALPGNIRAGTQRISEYAYFKNFNGRSFFIPRAEIFDYGSQLYYVSFTSNDDLYVGATRFLRITSGTSAQFDTFTTGAGKSLFLRASDLIELNDVRFSTNIQSITMDAATINLYNINFHKDQFIALNSKYGGADANGEGSGIYPIFGTSRYGRVNFINVSYDNQLIDTPAAFDAYGDNIAIGSLQNKVVPPAPEIVVRGGTLRLNPK